MRSRLVSLSVASLLALAGMGYALASADAGSSAAPPVHASTCHGHKRSCPPSTTPPSTPPPPAGHKMMVIIEENHSRAEALSGMPHLAQWAAQYGEATDYHAVTHPSLPNYLAIGGGSTFGVTDDNPPSSHPISGASVFGQTLAAGETARTYAESMPSNCAQSNSGEYAVRHNEWAYFVDSSERAGCTANDVPMGTTSSGNLASDIAAGALPVTGQMTPNVCNDAHDCSLATADAWLGQWIPQLMAGPDYTSGNLTIVITFDEDDSSAANNVAFVVIDPRLHGASVAATADHYSLTRWLDENAGVPPLRNAATASDLKSAFGL